MNIEEIVALLRQTESRSKRKLLDEAADAIEELAKASIVKRIPCEVDPRKEYVELDGIRLVCEEGQIVGWYRPGDGLAIDANAPTVDAVHMEANMENGLYTAHEVAVILADAFGDDCACNFNGNDEWLPYLCELQDACPNPCGVACWEQYLKYRHCKDEMEAKEK